MKKTNVVRPMNSAEISIFDSSVDIIIPFYGLYKSVTRLMESVFTYTRSNYYNLYLVDDCSPNSAFIRQINKNAAKKNISNFKSFRCKEQRGFAGACQVAYDRSNSPYVCFLHSDCVVEDIGWLRNLGESLLNLKDQKVRMVVPRTNNSMNGDPRHEAGKMQKGKDVILESGKFASLYCFLCHRDLFPRCGGFIKNYPYGFYEDEEFAYRMQHKGYQQAICGSSWVNHEGGATVRSLWRKNQPIRKVMEEENRDRCIIDMKAL